MAPWPAPKHRHPGATRQPNPDAPSRRRSPAASRCTVERLAAALGAREGTGPDDDPLLRSQRRQGFERGLAQGRAETRARMVRRILRSRGIAVSEGRTARQVALNFEI